MKFQPKRVVPVAVLTLLMGAPVLAGGFAVMQQGAKASGRGGAFTATADDASAAYYNPAAAIHLEGWNLYVGGTLLDSESDLSTTGGGSDSMNNDSMFAGNLFVTGPLGDNYAFTFAAFNPYLLDTEWSPTDRSSDLAQSALITDWSALEFNANFVARLTAEWSIAFGVEWVDFDVDDFSREYNFDDLIAHLQPLTAPFQAQQNIVMDGEKAGASISLHYRGEESGYRFGLSFRSQKIVKLRGMMDWTMISASSVSISGGDGTCPFADPISAATFPALCDFAGNSVSGAPMSGLFTPSQVATEFTLPATVQIGFGKEGAGKWDWEVDLTWTRWGNWDSTDADVSEPNGIIRYNDPNVIPEDVVETTGNFRQFEDWNDTVAIGGGVDYHINDSHTVRGGLIWDQSPVDDDFARPYNPDADKIGITAGYGWEGFDGLIRIDVFGQYWSVSDAEPGSDEQDFVVPGTYETDLFAAGASVQFSF